MNITKRFNAYNSNNNNNLTITSLGPIQSSLTNPPVQPSQSTQNNNL